MFIIFFIVSLVMVVPIDAIACYESSIQSPTPFMGNHGEVIRLSDGGIWQVNYSYEYLYKYYPNVIMCPEKGKLIIKDKLIDISCLSGNSSSYTANRDFIESKIHGEFHGWDGETIFLLDNGQIWQQSSYAYHYTYKYRPPVIIFKNGSSYEMQVDGIDNRVKVNRIG
jgi:hypothetical protein